MTYDQDTIDEYRKPEYQPEHLYWNEGVERYEADVNEVVANAVDTLCGTDDIPEPLLTALLNWYRTTDTYASSVQYVIDEAAKP